MRYGRMALAVSVLLVAGAGLTCVRPRPPGDPTATVPPAPAGAGTFVAGSFQKLMTVGRHIEMAEEGETRLFVGRFDQGGVDGWLRSFPGASDSVAVAYLQNYQGVVVVGAFSRGINFDRPDQRLATSRQAGLFFTRFASTGRTVVATKIAEGGGFRAPTLVAEGDGFRVTVPFRGGAAVPGQASPPQEAGVLDIYLDASGRPRRTGFKPEGRLLQPGTTDPGDVPPAAPRGGLIHDDGQQSQYQMAFMMQAVCDYCAPNNGPWSGSPCASCRDKVFAAMPWCRDTAWTMDCMIKASSVCAGGGGVSDVCYCAHATGQVRESMPSFCRSPPAAPANRAPVVNRVCGIDGFCCSFEPAGGTYYPGWDHQCRGHGLSFDASGP